MSNIVPPNAIDAEKALLGACVQDGALVQSVVHLLEAEDFYLPSHGKIFDAMRDLHELSEAIDLITIETRLKSKGETFSAADLAGMAEIGFPSLPHVQSYILIIKETARKRSALKIFQQAMERINSSAELPELLSDVAASLHALENGNGKRSGLEPVLVRVSEVQREDVRWLWGNRIPLGKLTLLEGDPGVGKSFCSLAIATAVTRGLGLPGQARTDAGNVLILSSEDGIADTIRPRLEDMGADLERISILRGAKNPKGEERAVTLLDLDILERAMDLEKPKLTIVDPLIAYLAGRDEWKAGQVRGVLGPLAALAEKTGSAVMGIRHLVKSMVRAIYKGQGSIDFLAACRSAFVFGENPDVVGDYIMAHVKSSLAPKAASLSYSIQHGRFSWGGESHLTAEQVLAAPASEDEAGEKHEAEGFLRDVLNEGPLGSGEIKKQAREAGISERTLWRAKTSLKIKATKDGITGGWKWCLPS